MKEIKNAGLIKGEIEGNSVCYCVNKSPIEKFQNYLSDISEIHQNHKIDVVNQIFTPMNSNEKFKATIKQKYNDIAKEGSETSSSSCCCSGSKTSNVTQGEYDNVAGYYPEADLKLGCGLPVEFAKIKKGDVVVDLGSGAGNDCFVARHETSETGKVIGIDFTEVMIERARANAENLNFNNVEFRLGDIENIPVSNNYADVVISNCVMNLVPDKQKAFGDIYRILKPGGHFSISDIVLKGNLPENIKKAAENYAGCVASAIQLTEYIQIIKYAGFKNITIQKEKSIIVPNEILKNYLSDEEFSAYDAAKNPIFSITVYGEKLTEFGKCNSCC